MAAGSGVDLASGEPASGAAVASAGAYPGAAHVAQVPKASAGGARAPLPPSGSVHVIGSALELAVALQLATALELAPAMALLLVLVARGLSSRSKGGRTTGRPTVRGLRNVKPWSAYHLRRARNMPPNIWYLS